MSSNGELVDLIDTIRRGKEQKIDHDSMDKLIDEMNEELAA